jgi:hypothetical protein
MVQTEREPTSRDAYRDLFRGDLNNSTVEEKTLQGICIACRLQPAEGERCELRRVVPRCASMNERR